MADNTLPEVQVREQPPGGHAAAGVRRSGDPNTPCFVGGRAGREGGVREGALGTLREQAPRSVEAYCRRHIADIEGIVGQQLEPEPGPSGRRDAWPWPPPLLSVVF